MRYVSPAAAVAMQDSHIASVVVEVRLGSTLLAATYLSGSQKINVTDGSVQVDRRAKYRRSLSLTIVDSTQVLVPGPGNTILDPLLRPEITVYRGIQWYDSVNVLQEATWPLGVFLIETLTAKEDRRGEPVITLSGRDRGVRISDNKFLVPFNIVKGTLYSEAIKSIIAAQATGFTPAYNFETSTKTTDDIVFSNDGRTDPWEEAQKLAQSDGKELFLDPLGSFVLRTIPDPAVLNSNWTYNESTGSLLDQPITRTITSTENFNGIIVRSSAPWLLFPIQDDAYDTDPGSLTYYLGSYGKRPQIVDDAMIGTLAQPVANATVIGSVVPGVVGAVRTVALPAVAASGATVLTSTPYNQAQLTFASAHNLAVGDNLILTGFTPADWNANVQVVTVVSSTVVSLYYGNGYAAAAALALLPSVMGITEEISLQSIVNPAHEGGDVVTLVNDALNVSDNVSLESFVVPLMANQAMTAIIRRKRKAGG